MGSQRAYWRQGVLSRAVFRGVPAECVLAGRVAPEACLWQPLAFLEYTGVCVWAEVRMPLTLWNLASSSEKWSSQPLLPPLLCSWKGG